MDQDHAASLDAAGTVASHAELRAWLEQELGELEPATIVEHEPPPPLAGIGEMSRAQANAVLRQTFIDTFMSEADYAWQRAYLMEPAPRATRLRIDSPLPITDFMVMLARPAPAMDPLRRAAALCEAALRLHLRFASGDLSTTLSRAANKRNCSLYDNTFGVRIVAGEGEHEARLSKDSRHFLVLCRGHGYLVELFVEGEPASAVQIHAALAQIVADERPVGLLGLMRCIPLDLAAELEASLEPRSLAQLHEALFTLCLDWDDGPGRGPVTLDQAARGLCSGQPHNRWYGGTQIVVRPDAEAALMFSFMAGVDGVQGNELADELHRHAQAVAWTGADATKRATLHPRPVELAIPAAVAEQLRARGHEPFHDQQAVFTVPFGTREFKALSVSPNVAIQSLLMFGFKDTSGRDVLPETSQAVLVRTAGWGGAQLDWVRARPEGLRQFLDRDDDLERFRAAVRAQKAVIERSRQRLSPFLFFDNRVDESRRALVDFYMRLGREEAVGAYRHYLCACSRDARALDVITSSIVLWDSIEVLGRPGVRSQLTAMAGVHVLFDKHETRLSFIPNPAWERRLAQVVEHTTQWFLHLQGLDGERRGERKA